MSREFESRSRILFYLKNNLILDSVKTIKRNKQTKTIYLQLIWLSTTYGVFFKILNLWKCQQRNFVSLSFWKVMIIKRSVRFLFKQTTYSVPRNYSMDNAWCNEANSVTFWTQWNSEKNAKNILRLINMSCLFQASRPFLAKGVEGLKEKYMYILSTKARDRSNFKSMK